MTAIRGIEIISIITRLITDLSSGEISSPKAISTDPPPAVMATIISVIVQVVALLAELGFDDPVSA